MSHIESALAAMADGASDAQASRASGVSIPTLRRWRSRGLPLYVRRALEPELFCPGCGAASHEFGQIERPAYAYLLGLYLGDGHLPRVKSSWSLRISLDTAYPGIIAECCAAIETIRGRAPHVRPRTEKKCVQVDSGWRTWSCFLPQHGPGRKHARRIELVPWQESILETESGAFLRGLIHSDGWRGVNRVRVKGHDYAYPRYQFSNRSDDIRRLFTDACDRLGIAWRPWTRFHISVARRDAVARLDEFVGPKR